MTLTRNRQLRTSRFTLLMSGPRSTKLSPLGLPCDDMNILRPPVSLGLIYKLQYIMLILGTLRSGLAVWTHMLLSVTSACSFLGVCLTTLLHSGSRSDSKLRATCRLCV